MNRTWKTTSLALGAALALGACTGDGTRSDVAYDDEDTPRSAPAERPATAPAPATAATAPKRAPIDATTTPAPAPLAGDDELVGVESCDDYLETYRSCHRALGMYPPETIDARFQELRSSFVARAADPSTHDSLSKQCESLAEDMETALDGKDCPDEPDELVDSSLEDEPSLEDAIEDDEPDRD
jgi:hypothetical protein